MAIVSGGTTVINNGAFIGVEGIPTGTIVPWTDSTIASGFLECDGTAVSRTTYADLFAVIGTTYGAGDGSTTFNLPDLEDNVPIGKSPNKSLASTGGANTTPVTAAGNVGGSTANATLSEAQLASHDHDISLINQQTSPGSTINAQSSGPAGTRQTQNAGSGTGHSHNMSATFTGNTVNPSVLQPYLTVIYIIKT